MVKRAPQLGAKVVKKWSKSSKIDGSIVVLAHKGSPPPPSSFFESPEFLGANGEN